MNRTQKSLVGVFLLWSNSVPAHEGNHLDMNRWDWFVHLLNQPDFAPILLLTFVVLLIVYVYDQLADD